ncbi:NDR1/HIN1-like protein 10 [Cicer arietinum]|uniref:NDR1/HIN1-like protein 10 n=1 Tax=Cicer arietinum TaxID=3827 RepID=A0A1S2XTD6_CICAR|nr:NDR1/HIN1-like protein 10 [Cicer arietinum]
MYEKQQLNGAYYGPSIPPPRSSHRPSRGGGFGCCCGCLFNLIFKLILTVIIILGIAVFLFWLIVRPNVIKVHVTDATLTQFNFTKNNTLNYNLSLNITIRNPNKKLGIYYDYIEARTLYHDVRVDSNFIDPFYQGHKTTNVLNTLFKGEKVVLLGGDQSSDFNKEKSLGIYEIDVKLYLRVRFKLGAIKTRKIKPKVTCELRLPLTSGDGGSTVNGAFKPTKCDWDR